MAVLTITNTANVSTTAPGGVVRFTGTFTNTGQVAYTGITIAGSVTDVRDDASSNGDSTATSGTLSVTSTGLTWAGSIPVGGSVTISGSVTVNTPDTGNKVLVNTLSTAAAGSNCPSGSTDPRCSVSVPVLIPALTIVTSASATAAVPGQPVTVTVTVTDTGQTPYSGAVVTDSLDGALDDAAYNNDAAATSGSVSFSSPNLTWTGNLAVGASAVITYTMTVNDPDTGDKVIINTATSDAAGSACPPGATAAPCRVTVAVLTPGLTIAQSAGAGTTTPGSVVTYTVTVTNSGQTAYTGATFTDPLSGVLDDASYNNNAAATSGSVSFSSPNLTWTGNLAPGASRDRHVLGHGEQTRHRQQDPGQHDHLGHDRQQLRGRQRRPVLHDDGAGGGADDHHQLERVRPPRPGRWCGSPRSSPTPARFPTPGSRSAPTSPTCVDDATPNGDQTATSGTLTLTADRDLLDREHPGRRYRHDHRHRHGEQPRHREQGAWSTTLSTAAAGSNCPSGSTDPRCSASVTVLIPALTIVKTADVSTTSPGGVVHYTVTITDSGQTPYNGATYTDQLDGVLGDATYNGDAVATAGSVSFASPDMTWTGDLTAGASATVTYSVTVNNPDTGNRIMTNTVSSASPGNNCPPGGTDPRCTATVRDLVPGLDIVTKADTATATPGTVVHYTITATNTGETAYTGASFTEPLAAVLDDAAYNGDAAATAGSVSFASPNLTWTGNLAVGAVATITFSVTVSNPDTGDKSMASTVTSATAGNNCPASGGTDPDSAPPRSPWSNATTLTFTATADTAAAAAGGVVHYTITVANSGLTPFNGATFTAALGGVLDDASYDNDAAATGTGTVTFTSPSLTWTGDVPAGGTVTITYSVTVNSPDTGNHILASTITSTSTGSNCRAGSADPRCTATVNVAALNITASADVSSVSPGSDVQYTVTATNTGQAPYSDTSVTLHLADTFEDADYNGDLAATSGTVTIDSATQTATWTGDLAPGATVTITYSVTVIPPDADLNDRTLTLTVDSAALGNNCPAGGTDPACTAAVPVLVPALTITKTANTTAAVPGATVTYTITVADTGETPYTGATVTDSLERRPARRRLQQRRHRHRRHPQLRRPGPDLDRETWPSAQAVTITYSVTVRNPDTGGKLMVNFVTSTDPGSTCPFDSPNPGCTVTIPVLTPALTIVKTASAASAAPGQHVTYTITVTNTGQTPYTGAVVTDDLTGLLDDAAYGADAAATRGAVSYASPVLTWTGNLTPGQAATITYSVTVDNPETGDDILTNTVTSAASGSNCPSGSTDPRCTTAPCR